MVERAGLRHGDLPDRVDGLLGRRGTYARRDLQGTPTSSATCGTRSTKPATRDLWRTSCPSPPTPPRFRTTSPECANFYGQGLPKDNWEIAGVKLPPPLPQQLLHRAANPSMARCTRRTTAECAALPRLVATNTTESNFGNGGNSPLKVTPMRDAAQRATPTFKGTYVPPEKSPLDRTTARRRRTETPRGTGLPLYGQD